MKIQIYKAKNAKKEMNKLAKEGGRVVAVSPNIAKLYGVVVTFGRKRLTQMEWKNNGKHIFS